MNDVLTGDSMLGNIDVDSHYTELQSEIHSVVLVIQNTYSQLCLSLNDLPAGESVVDKDTFTLYTPRKV